MSALIVTLIVVVLGIAWVRHWIKTAPEDDLIYNKIRQRQDSGYYDSKRQQ